MPNTDVEQVEAIEGVFCYQCGLDVTGNDDVSIVEGDVYCPRCFNEVFDYCHHCGDRIVMDDAHVHGDDYYCDDCYDAECWTCVECGLEGNSNRRSYRDEVGDLFCRDCFNNRYEQCEVCGERRQDVENGECGLCRGGAIRQYSFVPVFKYNHVKGQHARPCPRECYAGIEIEVEVGNDNDRASVAEGVKSRLADVYCKDDGSLQHGIEIVSHPMTLQAFKEARPKWTKMLEHLRALRCKSASTRTCGIHVHLSRNYLQKAEVEIQRARLFFYACRRQIELIARRGDVSYAHYETRRPDKREVPAGRYWAFNMDTGHNTAEIRCFKGSLKYETIRASIEFSFALAEFCASHSTSMFEMGARRNSGKLWRIFYQWAKNKQTFSYFITYAEQRGVACA